MHNIEAELDPLTFLTPFLLFFLWLSPLFPSFLFQSQGLDCCAEAWQRQRMGKVQGRQPMLPASLESQRVNLHWGHRGFSLATAPHMPAACHQPCSCSLTPPFCISLSSFKLHVQLQLSIRSGQYRSWKYCISSETKLSFHLRLWTCARFQSLITLAERNAVIFHIKVCLRVSGSSAHSCTKCCKSPGEEERNLIQSLQWYHLKHHELGIKIENLKKSGAL